MPLLSLSILTSAILLDLFRNFTGDILISALSSFSGVARLLTTGFSCRTAATLKYAKIQPDDKRSNVDQTIRKIV